MRMRTNKRTLKAMTMRRKMPPRTKLKIDLIDPSSSDNFYEKNFQSKPFY